MDCPYCKQPIITPVWECHTGQDFCSVECGIRLTFGRPIPRPILSLLVLLGARFRLTSNADDFAEEYFIGPFIVSNDILSGWLLFLNHNQYGYMHLADLNRLISIVKLILNGEIQRAISFLTASLLDCVGIIVSRGHWTIGPLHIHYDDNEGWPWETRSDTQQL